MRCCLALLIATHAHAEPMLGESTKRGPRSSETVIEVDPVIAAGRTGHLFVYDWDAYVEGTPIDRDRFYELVDRPDLSRRVTLRRAAGIVAIVGGLALAAFGADELIAHGHDWGIPVVFGGALVGFGGCYLEVEADPTSAEEAQALASATKHIALGGRF